jgi:hypothetical protein
MDTAKIADPGLWAEIGGLNGLVIFALFAALGIFIHSMGRIYEMHRDDMRNLMDMHAKERDDWGRVVDARQKETNATLRAMATVLSELNNRARRYHDDTKLTS